jgi:micrococcal nuclease
VRRRNPFAFGAFLVVIALSAALSLLPPASPARSEATRQTPPARHASVRMIDGDTLIDRVSGTTYRIANIDTAEAGDNARCAAERRHASRATDEARRLVSTAERVEFRPTGRIDRYGRTIALILIDGRDLGEALIAEGLARPWRGRRESWCDSQGRLVR